MNYVYVVFFTTNTHMGRLIRFSTRNKFNHVSFSIDPNLNTMYSFARYKINSPIRGGFVTEKPERYLYNGEQINIKICSLALGDEEYERILKELDYFEKHKDQMTYNTFNAILSVFNKKLIMKNAYTCLEFVAYLLNIHEIMTIGELEDRLKNNIVYHGNMQKTTTKMDDTEACDTYFNKRDILEVFTDTALHLGRIFKRLII